MVHVAPQHQRHSNVEGGDVVEEAADVVEEVGEVVANIKHIQPSSFLPRHDLPFLCGCFSLH